MKKAVIICMLGILFFQYYPAKSKGENFPYSIGPFITLKGGVNAADVPQNFKNGFTMNGLPDFGATGFIPFGDKSQFGLDADLGYSTYAFDIKSGQNFDAISTTQISYFTISPNIFIYGFTAGLNFGIPLSGTVKSSTTETDIKTEDLSLFAEFRIGGDIPLYYDETGRLNLRIQFGYFLTGQSKENYNNTFNFHPASGALGVSYLFNVS